MQKFKDITIPLKERQLDFLEDMISYYSADPLKRRCSVEEGNGGGKSFYSPKLANRPDSEGCAIGRHLSPEIQEKLDEIGYSVNNKETFDELPEWMQNLNQDFLFNVQDLHDNEMYWNDDKINREGLKALEIIKKRDYSDEREIITLRRLEAVGFKRHKVVGGTYNFIKGNFRINTGLARFTYMGIMLNRMKYMDELKEIYFEKNGEELAEGKIAEIVEKILPIEETEQIISVETIQE